MKIIILKFSCEIKKKNHWLYKETNFFFLNACITYKILLKILVIAVLHKEVFQKLKTIKILLKIDHSTTKMSVLSILSIKNEMLVKNKCVTNYCHVWLIIHIS